MTRLSLLAAVSVPVLSSLFLSGCGSSKPETSGPVAVTKVLRGRKGVIAGTERITVNHPDEDHVVLLKIENVPAELRDNLFDTADCIENGQSDKFYSMIVGKKGPVLAGALVSLKAKSITVKLAANQPEIKVDLPAEILDEASLKE